MKLETLINENYEKLNENDLYIWNYILHHKEECKNISIQDLAAKCNVSHTTISRFARKLDLEGYSELKLYLKWETRNEAGFDSREIQNVYQDHIMTMDTIMKQDLYEIYEMLKNAGRVFAYGTGAVQKNASKDLKRVLLPAGYIVHVIEGRSETKTILLNVQENDVFFLYSLSGNNSFINEFALRLKARGVKIITITQNGNNELSRIGDVSLQFYTHPVTKNINRPNLYMTSQFFIMNEFLLLKLLELE